SSVPLYEALDESERRLGHFLPAAVDGERVATAWNHLDLGHTRVARLALVGSVRDRPRDGVVLLTIEYQERTSLGINGVHLGFGPRVKVRCCRLEQRSARRRHGKSVVELLGLLFTDRVGECEAELFVGQRSRLVAIQRVG